MENQQIGSLEIKEKEDILQANMVEAEKGNSTSFTLTANQLEVLQQLISQSQVFKTDNADNPTPLASLVTKGNI